MQALKILLSSYIHRLHAPNPYGLKHCQLKLPPTPGTALQNRIESKLEKSLVAQFNIQLQQQMGVFQASMLEAMQSLRDKITSVKKSSEAGVDQISASDPKPGTSKQTDDLPSHPNTQSNIKTSEHMDEPMNTDFCGPALPPQFGENVQSELRSDPSRSDQNSKQSECVCSLKAKKYSDKRKYKGQAKCVYQSSSSEESESFVQVKKSSKPKRAPSDQDKHKTDPFL